MSKTASLLGYCPSTVVKVIQEWRNIHLLKWDEPASTMATWVEFKRHGDAAGLDPATAAVSVLSLPHTQMLK